MLTLSRSLSSSAFCLMLYPSPEGSKLKATFVDAQDKEHVAELHGDMFGTTANIRLSTGASLAYISRKLISAADAVADKQTVSRYNLWR